MKENKTQNIIVFGAGHLGRLFIKHLSAPPLCIFDNNKNIWGKKIDGILVSEPKLIDNVRLIIANDNHDIDIVAQLLRLGYTKFSVACQTGAYGADEYKVDDFDYSNYDDFSVKQNKVALVSCGYSGSNAYCFKYMVEEYHLKNKLDLVYLETRNKCHEYYYEILTSNVLVLTSSFSSLNRIVIQAWHGMMLKGIGYFDPKTSPEGFESTHRDASNARFILSTGPLFDLAFGACHGIHRTKFAHIGTPRNDVLLLSDGRRKLSELYPQIVDKKVILYMPTFRPSCQDIDGYIFQYPDFRLDEVDDFLKKRNMVIVAKMHQEDNKKFGYMKDCIESIVFLEDSDFEGKDFYEYMNAADVMLTDYSSVLFDYLLLDRPIIFAYRDYEEYAKKNHFVLSPPQFYSPGPKIKSWKELENEIDIVLSGRDEWSSERMRITKIVHDNIDSHSSERFINLIENEICK